MVGCVACMVVVWCGWSDGESKLKLGWTPSRLGDWVLRSCVVKAGLLGLGCVHSVLCGKCGGRGGAWGARVKCVCVPKGLRCSGGVGASMVGWCACVVCVVGRGGEGDCGCVYGWWVLCARCM